jgi:NAD(P)-dependent dehydrogenase (short-subunit alcohol dehydrogenase family)
LTFGTFFGPLAWPTSSGGSLLRVTTRTWLITGASSGLGSAIAEAALGAGDAVVAVARRTSALEGLHATAPERVHAIAFDVTDAAGAPAVVEEALSRSGRIDVLVNCAGRALVGAVEETSEEELREQLDLHFFGPVALIRAVLPSMREQRGGAIVQISSLGGRLSFAGVGGYSASKFALEGISEALAAEVAPFGIRVLVVEPGAMRTGLHRDDSRRESAPLAAYEETVGASRAAQAAFDGNQPGDPQRAAAAILGALVAEDPPLRLPLGSDAVDAIDDALARARAEFDAWAAVGRTADMT